ncbi:peptide chain release factor N(5)-glutamine methyltransferase [Spiroplasma endosymbiont of Amphibalanus improvisus]|uniref:peptide chain release factor N(5)-glutamine methyltransferase n=1 Tax=Spiroplasma endosymbiont of Amphibalanus improvisus TaxID=3066327 RepID=UPI00313B70F9
MTNQEVINYICEKLNAKNPSHNKKIAKSFICYLKNISINDLYTSLYEKCNLNINKIDKLIKKINKSIPLEYLINEKYFLNNKFYVNKNVLIPRPETEEMVLEALSFLKTQSINKKINVFDICTGSGNIAISIAKNYKANIYASDISFKVLKVARKNAKDLGANNITFLKGDFLKPFIKLNLKGDLIIINPPYISSKDRSVDYSTKNYEPKKALFTETGLEFYNIFFQNYHKIINNEGIIFLEFGYEQKKPIYDLMEKYICLNKINYKFFKDTNKKDRFLFISLKNNI